MRHSQTMSSPRKTGPSRHDRDVVRSALRVAHADDAAVAAAQAAAHDAFDRQLRRAAVRGGERGRRPPAWPRAAGVDHDRAARVRRGASARSSGTVTRPRSPRLPSSVASTSSHAEALEDGRGRTARRPSARRRTAWSARRGPGAPRRAWRTARGRRRRRPSTPRPAGRPARTAGRADRGRRSARPATRRRAAGCRRRRAC